MSVVLRVVPVGGRRGSSPRGAIGRGLRWAGTRCIGSVALRSPASVARASADARRGRATPNRGRQRAEPGAAPDTAICSGTHRSSGDGGAGELYVRPPSRACACGGAGRVVRVSKPRASVVAPRGAYGRLARLIAASLRWLWPGADGDTVVRVGGAPLRPIGCGRGSSPRVAVVGGPRCVGTRRRGSVVLRPVAPVGGHPRMRGADVSEPNPALHLTPPADSGRIADPVMAVQVSFMFGNPKALDRACGGAERMVRKGEQCVSGSAWCPRVAGAAHRREVRLGVAGSEWGHGGASRWGSAWCRSGLARLVAAGGGWCRPPVGRGTVRRIGGAPHARIGGTRTADARRSA